MIKETNRKAQKWKLQLFHSEVLSVFCFVCLFFFFFFFLDERVFSVLFVYFVCLFFCSFILGFEALGRREKKGAQ